MKTLCVMNLKGSTGKTVTADNLAEDELRRHSTGSYVFIELYGTVLDAMEDFRIGFTLKN